MKYLEEDAMIESLSRFIRKLNDEEDALVVVEGVRDAKALRGSGFSGELFMLCHNSSVSKLEDESSEFKKTILLLDNDSEGRKLVERTRRLLSGRVKLDLFYQRALLPASRGRSGTLRSFRSTPIACRETLLVSSRSLDMIPAIVFGFRKTVFRPVSFGFVSDRLFFHL